MGGKKSKHDYVVWVCSDSCCLDAKAQKLRRRLKTIVQERGLEDQIKIKKAPCLKRCSDAPVVEICPGDVLARKVKPKYAEVFLDALLSGAYQKGSKVDLKALAKDASSQTPADDDIDHDDED